MASQAAHVLKMLLVFAAIVTLSACASNARPGAMIAALDSAHIIDQKSPYYMSLSVASVGGGRETNPLLQSQVSSGDFKTALEQSLQLNTMLAATNPKYGVTATLDDLKQPMIGFGMTVTAVVHYVVRPIPDGPSVFDQTITSPYTAAFSDAFVGIERLRLANEGAIRTNIGDFVHALAIDLPPNKPIS